MSTNVTTTMLVEASVSRADGGSCRRERFLLHNKPLLHKVTTTLFTPGWTPSLSCWDWLIDWGWIKIDYLICSYENEWTLQFYPVFQRSATTADWTPYPNFILHHTCWKVESGSILGRIDLLANINRFLAIIRLNVYQTLWRRYLSINFIVQNDISASKQ